MYLLSKLHISKSTEDKNTFVSPVEDNINRLSCRCKMTMNHVLRVIQGPYQKNMTNFLFPLFL
jgi:hypothetical protein